ncbi:HNH endonuclease [Kribbella sp. NBC_01510]
MVKDARTAEQRRADVAADLFEHILHNGLDWLGRRLPDQHRRRPHIEVVVPASTLLGLDDDPAELTGYGPITADMARRIAADGTWRRLLTDPVNGAVLEAATTRHDPSTSVTETLLARHPVCAWPGCNRTSRDCDRDHLTPFARNGTTSLTGLAPYCEYHHVIKDTPAWGWSTISHPDGSITLTTPTGHRYTTVPPARGPISQPVHSGPAIRTAFEGPGAGPGVGQSINGASSESPGGGPPASDGRPPS